MSLRLKMGLDEDSIGRDTRIIILKTEAEGSVGVLVDEVKEVIKLSEDQIESTTGENVSPESRRFCDFRHTLATRDMSDSLQQQCRVIFLANQVQVSNNNFFAIKILCDI